ncbi:hypothetical protein D3C72_2543700 [compost metagenome]
MGFQLQPRQGQKIVDQTAHAGGLIEHDAEEFFLRLGISLGRALNGFDKAAQ